MRKSQITRILQGTPLGDESWMDVEGIASVEVSSEDSDHPIESALLLEGKRGWRAVHPGMQKIRLIFDEPQELRRIMLAFEDTENTRTQEFVLGWSPHIESSFRDIVRQQWNFSPPDSVFETEDYVVELSGVKVLELIIVPDRNGRELRASLVSLRLA